MEEEGEEETEGEEGIEAGEEEETRRFYVLINLMLQVFRDLGERLKRGPLRKNFVLLLFFSRQ